MLLVKDIMTRPVVVITSSATVENAIWLMRTKRVRSLIVEEVEHQEPYGIVTERDIVYKVIAKGISPHFVQVGHIMRRPCIRMPMNATWQEAAQIFSATGLHRAPVIENEQLLGIISLTDLLGKGHSPLSHDELSRRVQQALQHARIVDDQDVQIQQECTIAWQVLEEMQPEIVDSSVERSSMVPVEHSQQEQAERHDTPRQ